MRENLPIKYLQIIKSHGFDAKFVGGVVRDFLSGKKTKDIDISTTANPEQISEIFKNYNINTNARHYGTITIYEKGLNIEITTTRSDIACYGRNADVAFCKSFQEDSRRRDFTINAIYMDENGNIDDFHNGLQHLKNREVVFIGNANDRICEDFLRIFRYFRFCSYMNALINTEYVKIFQLLKDNLKQISKERNRSELEKIAASNEWSYYFQQIQDSNIFDVFFKTKASVNILNKIHLSEEKFHFILKLISFAVNLQDLEKIVPLQKHEKKLITFLIQTNDIFVNLNKPKYELIRLFIAKKEYFICGLILQTNLTNDDIENFISFYNIKTPNIEYITSRLQRKTSATLVEKIFEIFIQNEFNIADETIIEKMQL